MKTFMKTLLAGGALVAAGAAHAAPINVTISDSATAEADFFSFLAGPVVTEGFDGLGGAYVNGGTEHTSWENKGNTFNTAVGTFELTDPGQSGLNVFNNELMIESNRTGEFGREVLADGDFWLDSNDAEEVVWTLGAPLTGSFNAFGFYLADASDISANLTLTFSDGSSSGFDIVTYPQSNGNVRYVSVTSGMSIVGGTLTFSNSSGNDGWGINNVTVGTLPEPGTLLLMGLGLLGLGAARRRAAK